MEQPQPELEQKIAAWRARLSAALPGQEETVRELEEHLRDHIEGQMRRGRAADAAFTQAVARIGEPRALAREFARAQPGWRGVWAPARVIYLVTGGALLMLVGSFAMAAYGGLIGALEGAEVIGWGAGYLALFAAGLMGLCVLATGWGRAPGERDLRAQGRELRRIAAIGSVCMAAGVTLYVLSRMNAGSRGWSWTPRELGMVAIGICLGLLWLAQSRVTGDFRVRVLLALLGVSALTVAGYQGAVTPLVPFGWLYASAFLSHGAVVLLHVRLAQVEGEGRMRPAGA